MFSSMKKQLNMQKITSLIFRFSAQNVFLQIYLELIQFLKIRSCLLFFNICNYRITKILFLRTKLIWIWYSSIKTPENSINLSSLPTSMITIMEALTIIPLPCEGFLESPFSWHTKQKILPPCSLWVNLTMAYNVTLLPSRECGQQIKGGITLSLALRELHLEYCLQI